MVMHILHDVYDLGRSARDWVGIIWGGEKRMIPT